MRPLGFARPGQTLRVLCLGAHADDVEIGAGGTLLNWIASGVELRVLWCVLSAPGQRKEEAHNSARLFLQGAASVEVRLAEFRDGFFPNDGAHLKEWMEDLKYWERPDAIFTHRHDDAHQDHREVSRLTWNTFRDHFILEYEIPKWDGDLARPNLYSALPVEIMEKKTDFLLRGFATQRSKNWFDPEVFRGLARLRGIECRAPQGYAEGFYLRKALLA